MIDWKFWIGDVVIPIGIFVLGFVVGKTSEKKAKAKIKGDKNVVIQNSEIGNKQGK